MYLFRFRFKFIYLFSQPLKLYQIFDVVLWLKPYIAIFFMLGDYCIDRTIAS